jgi:CheY-like chemotaxis protein
MALNSRSIEVLLVEDNPGDVNLTRIALANSLGETGIEREVKINLSVVNDGVEAMAFLQQKNGYEQAVKPDLILLDWNLPRKNGRQVLGEIDADERFKRIPVVVLTTSQADEDIINAYNLHANCFITKPVDFQKFVQIIQSIEDFWFSIVKLPPR